MADRLNSLLQNIEARHTADAPAPEPTQSACRPDCAVCGGLGWVMRDYPITDARFGKISPCPNADIYRIYGAKTGLDKSEMSLAWGTIKDNGNARRAARAVYDVLEQGFGMVYLWGPAGTGKTRILKTAVAQWMLTRRQPAAYAGMSDIVDYLRAAFDAENASDQAASRMFYYSTTPLLAIDEVDKMRGTEFASEKRFALLDRRYELAARENGVTLMASNSNPREFLNDYILSRLNDGRNAVIQMTGADVRPSMKNERI